MLATDAVFPGEATRPARPVGWLAPVVLAAILVVADGYSHTLFHTLAELFAATVAVLVAVVGWQAYPFSRNRFLIYLACGYFWIGALDLLHAFTYKGMGVLPGDFSAMSIQFWVGTRYLEALLLLTAPLAFSRGFHRERLLTLFGALAALLTVSIFTGVFPAAFVPGEGLTPFKVASEYVIIAILGAAWIHLLQKRAWLDDGLVRLTALSIGATAAAEYMFTLYQTVGEWPTVVGHILKLFSYWFIYVGTVRTTLTEPFRILARNASTFDAVPEPTVVVDEKGIIRQSNRAARRFLGMTDSECIGQHCHELFHDTAFDREGCPLCLAIGTGRSVEAREVQLSRVGQWHEVSLAPVASGVATAGMVHVSRDVTQRKAAQKALRDSEARFRGLVENTHDLVWEIDANGAYTYVSPQVTAILGYSPQEVLGKSPFDFMPPEEAARVRALFEPIAARRATLRDFENTNRRQDGRLVVLETSGVPYFTESGEFAGYRGIDRDITERKEAERALRASERTYRTLVDNLPQHIFLKDRESVYVSCNKSYADLLGIDPAAIAGRSVYDLHPEALAERYRADDRRIMNSAQAEEFDEPFMAGGREITVHTVKTPVKDDEGHVIGLLGIFWDVTEERRAERELERYRNQLERRVEERTAELEATNKELQSFSYSVSHDLRAPLRSIDGFSSLLMKRYNDLLDETGKDYLTRVRSASQRMGQLIDDLLKLSRVSQAELNCQEVDLAALARSAIGELRELEPSRRVSFVCEGPLHAFADPHLARILLDNLLGNAWKFTAEHPEPRIEFGCRKEGGETVFFVRDNGAGFDMQYAGKLFRAFQRLHGADEFPGTGIGLATVARIVRAHRGRVWAEAAKGEGATFYFQFRTRQDEDEAARGHRAEAGTE